MVKTFNQNLVKQHESVCSDVRPRGVHQNLVEKSVDEGPQARHTTEAWTI